MRAFMSKGCGKKLLYLAIDSSARNQYQVAELFALVCLVYLLFSLKIFAYR